MITSNPEKSFIGMENEIKLGDESSYESCLTNNLVSPWLIVSFPFSWSIWEMIVSYKTCLKHLWKVAPCYHREQDVLCNVASVHSECGWLWKVCSLNESVKPPNIFRLRVSSTPGSTVSDHVEFVLTKSYVEPENQFRYLKNWNAEGLMYQR